MSRQRPMWRRRYGTSGRGIALRIARAAILLAMVAGASARATAQVPFELVHTLPSGPIGPVPDVPVIEGPDGSFYGITSRGGVFGNGTFFKTTRLGVTTTLYSFKPADSGPPLAFILASDGNFYGLTSETIGSAGLQPRFFRATAGGTVTILSAALQFGASVDVPGEPLLEMPDGNFYWFGINGIRRISPTGQFSVVSSQLRYFSARSAVRGNDGQAYIAFPNGGATNLGGSGAIVRMDVAGNLTTLQTFKPGPDGYLPGALVRANDGNLYGTTSAGGAFNRGTVFRMNTAGAILTLYSFAAADDAPSRLFQAKDGTLYGVVTPAPALFTPVRGLGTVVRIGLDGSVATLHTGDVDSAVPVSLMQASDGAFFGTTASGGGAGLGSIFQFAADGTVPSSFRFSRGPEGSFVLSDSTNQARTAGVIQTADGTFYGVAASGGFFDQGTAFKMSRDGTLEVLHDFAGGADGAVPRAELLQASDGNLYGTTSIGGTAEAGTVFRITPSGTFSIIHQFLPAIDGAIPLARLIQAADGSLYGTTSSGGAANAGTIFRIRASGSFEVAYSFTNGSDGGRPDRLIQNGDGAFYGTSASGGSTGRGLIYRLDPNGSFAVMHAFTEAEGREPSALIQTRDGNFYGMLVDSISRENGRVFRSTQAGETAVFQVFGGVDAYAFRSNEAKDLEESAVGCCGVFTITEGGDGNLYITSSTSTGQISRMTRDGLVSRLDVFPRNTPFHVISPLWQGDDGQLYGTGTYFTSAIFRLGLLPRAPTSDIRSKLTLFRPSTGTWFFADGTSLSLGAAGDWPVPGDYNGDGVLDVAMFRPSTGVWSIVGVGVTAFGLPGDIPVPADYDGDGTTDLAVFRPSSATWYIAGRDPVVFGVPGDVPVPGDYAGIGHAQIAIARRGSFYVDGQPGPIVVGGRPEDLAVPADYDGDGRLDMAVYRPSTGSWIVRDAATGQRTTTGFGTASDRPAPQDLDDDGRAELVLFRRATGTWFTYNSRTGAGTTVRFGLTGDQPIWAPPLRAAAPGDVDGDAHADLAVYRATGEWLSPAFPNVGRATAVAFGAPTLGDIPVPGDYDGDGTMDLAIFRQSTGDWFLAPLTREVASIQWGVPALGDRPVPADYDGDGVTDVAIYRRTTGEWFILPSTTGRVIRLGWGQAASTDDLPVALDFDGDGLADLAIYRQTTGEWFIRRSADQGTTYVAGSDATAAALPVPADYDGDGKADVAVFREATGEWLITRSSTGRLQRLLWGDRASGDIPAPADYDGDGAADVGVYRATTGEWLVLRSSDRRLLQSSWGCPTCGDTPVLQPVRR